MELRARVKTVSEIYKPWARINQNMYSRLVSSKLIVDAAHLRFLVSADIAFTVISAVFSVKFFRVQQIWVTIFRQIIIYVYL